jgi:hypothetical protein
MKIEIKEMTDKEVAKDEQIIEIQEDVKISQDGKTIILEKGDKIEILKEDETTTWKDFRNRGLSHNSFSEFVFEIPYQKIKADGVNSKVDIVGESLKISPSRGNTVIVTPEDSDIVTVYEDFNYGFKVDIKSLHAVFYGYY